MDSLLNCSNSFPFKSPSKRPDIRTSPESTFSIPHMQLSKVDFPLPLGPIKATRSPDFNSRSTPRSTETSPKDLVTDESFGEISWDTVSLETSGTIGLSYQGPRESQKRESNFRLPKKWFESADCGRITISAKRTLRCGTIGSATLTATPCRATASGKEGFSTAALSIPLVLLGGLSYFAGASAPPLRPPRPLERFPP